MKTLRLFCLLLALLMCCSTFVIACNNDTVDPSGDQSGDQGSKQEFCTVSFENTNLEKQSVTKGSTIQKPSDPVKENYIFVDWYTDANYTNKAVFPIKVDTDISVYARFFTYQEAFQIARENTIGNDVPGFEYEYTMGISASYLGVVLDGTQSGTAKYSTLGEVNYYDERTNAGPLLNDGTSYKIRRGTSLQNISLDETGKIKNFSVEQVESTYKYDSSSLAKAVFAYTDEEIKSISPTDQKNKYELKTTVGASSIIALVANNINNPVVEKLLFALPETAADTKLYVSFNGDKIDSYTYVFKINVSQLQFDLVYDLKFTDIGTAKNIETRSFVNIAFSSSEIESLNNEASAIVDNFKNKESSGYDFKVDTGVDFGATTGEINSTFKGSAFRNILNTSVFFHNDIEIDSDFKNSDLYKDKGIKDVHVKLTKLSNGEVHLIEKKLLADSTQKVDDFVDSDLTSFYLFDILTHSGTYSFAEKEVDENIIVYTFGLTNEGALALITWLNSSLCLDPLNNASADVLVYGDFDPSSIMINTGKISVTVKDGVLDTISVKVEGDFVTSFENSADFTSESNAQIKLDMKLTVNADGDTFEPFDSVKDAK